MDNTKVAVAVFDKLAASYEQRFMNVDMYEGSFDVFCDLIEHEKAHILDIACGPGNITKYLLHKRPDFSILAIDLAPNMLQLAKANAPAATFQLMDARQISSLTGKYDGIMCGFCLPYLTKEEAVQLIQDAAVLLVPGGALCLSTMEDNYSKSGLQTASSGDQVYMYYHEAGYLAEALKANGLSITDIRRQASPAAGNMDTTDLLIVAVKNIASR